MENVDKVETCRHRRDKDAIGDSGGALLLIALADAASFAVKVVVSVREAAFAREMPAAEPSAMPGGGGLGDGASP